MRKSIPLLLVAALVLSSCGAIRDSRVNPFNWFGRGESREISAGDRNPLIPRRSALSPKQKSDSRQPIRQITGLFIERTPSGAIIRAEGLSERQGAYELGLRPVIGEDVPADTLRFAFVAYQANMPVGPEPTRRVVAAQHLTTQDLTNIRRIEVVGQANVMTARR